MTSSGSEFQSFVDFWVKLFIRHSLVACSLKILESWPRVRVSVLNDNSCFGSIRTNPFKMLYIAIILTHLRLDIVYLYISMYVNVCKYILYMDFSSGKRVKAMTRQKN